MPWSIISQPNMSCFLRSSKVSAKPLRKPVGRSDVASMRLVQSLGSASPGIPGLCRATASTIALPTSREARCVQLEKARLVLLRLAAELEVDVDVAELLPHVTER